MLNNDLKENLTAKALSLGFNLIGAAPAKPIGKSHSKEFDKWISGKMNAQMAYMERNLEKRVNSSILFPAAKSVICVALSYNSYPEPDLPRQARDQDNENLKIARYARYPDYHAFLKDKLYQLADFLKNEASRPKMQFKVCVDSAPVAERSLAQSAGLGFIGKNRMLIHPELGPELFLGELLVDIEFEPDQPIEKNCGNCHKCIDACPTGALTEQGLNANKCLSYLTIEHPDGFDDPSLLCGQGVLFGCDRCVLACPYTQNALVVKNADFKPDAVPAILPAREILEMAQEQFARRFNNTPLYRTGLYRLKRNARAAIGTKKKLD